MSKYCIVVLSYNHPELTARAVESAINFIEMTSAQQKQNAVLLVHNGSEKKNIEHLKIKFPKVIHTVINKNQGYSGGVNAGFKNALALGYKWLFLLTNDCRIQNLDIPDSTTKPAIIAPIIYRRKSNNVDSCGGLFIPAQAKLRHLRSEEEFKHAIITARASNSLYPYIPGSAFWIHSEIIEKAGYLDESLDTYWEDVEFSVRIFNKNLTLLTNSKNKILHLIGKTNHKNPHYTTYLFQRNRRRVSRQFVNKSPLNIFQLNLTLAFNFVYLTLYFLSKQDWLRLKLFYQATRDSYKIKHS